MKKNTKDYKELYYELLNKNMLLHETLLAYMEGKSFSKRTSSLKIVHKKSDDNLKTYNSWKKETQ